MTLADLQRAVAVILLTLSPDEAHRAEIALDAALTGLNETEQANILNIWLCSLTLEKTS